MPWVENEGGTGSGGSGGQAPGTPAYNPAWYALTAIWIDPVNGSDANTGSAIGNPLKTWAEVVRRYGSTTPLFNYGQSCTYTFLNSQLAGTDPIFFEPRVTGGGQAILTATPTLFQSGTFTALTAKTRGAPGSLLKVTTSGAGVTANMLMVNTTRNSQALVDSVAGQLATMQQPQTTASLTTTAVVPNPVEDDTWAAGDNYSLYTLLTLNLKRWAPVGGDETAASQPCGGWIFTASIADPSGGNGASAYFVKCESACNVLVNCLISGRVDLSSSGGRGTANTVVAGCSVLGQCLMASGQVGVYGGASGSVQNNANAIITNDHLAHGSINHVGGLITLGNVYCTGTITASGGIILQGGFVWGAWTPNVDPGTRWWNNAGGWAATCLTENNFQIGGVSSGSGFTAATGVWSAGAISPITPAALDAAAGTAIVSPLTGAGYSKSS